MRILRQDDSAEAKVSDICSEHQITEQTFYRGSTELAEVWRRQYRGRVHADARRLKEMEEENRRLKALVADQAGP
jgi:putative transposase